MEAIINTQTRYSNFKAPVFTVFSNEPLLSIEDKLLTLETLQESLDLKELMDNFAALVAKFIRPLNIRFQSTFGVFNASRTQRNNFTKRFNLTGRSDSRSLGTIIYQSESYFLTNEDKLLTELHSLLIPSLKHALKIAELNSLVYIDCLTNIGNRAYYNETIQHAIEQSSRTNLPMTLMVLDINEFKPINDTYGHARGDEVLTAFADVLRASIRTSDSVFRLGGDEFVIILQPSENCSMDKIQQRINKKINQNKTLNTINFSASIGYSQWQHGIDATQLFEQADRHLYLNKASIIK